MCECYVLGTGTVPLWCKSKLMTYKRKDGAIGFEFCGERKNFSLKMGDMLILENGRINVKRMDGNEGKRFSSASQEAE